MKKQFFSGVPEEVGEFLLHLLKFKNAAVNNNLSVILYPLSFLFNALSPKANNVQPEFSLPAQLLKA